MTTIHKVSDEVPVTEEDLKLYVSFAEKQLKELGKQEKQIIKNLEIAYERQGRKVK